MKNNILVIAVHPDDETLGCGGTLLRYKAEGYSIHWLIVTSIYAQEENKTFTINSKGQIYPWQDARTRLVHFSPEKVKIRYQELRQVSREYGFDTVHELCFPTMCLDQIPFGLLVSKISEVMNTVQPDTLILPFKSDIHSDHRVSFEAAYSCTKSFRYPFLKKIMMMEVPSETDFAPSIKEDMFCPNVFVDVSGFLDKKNEIMGFYKGELGQHPFPRSKENIQALALNRGATAGCRYAESFMLLKEMI